MLSWASKLSLATLDVECESDQEDFVTVPHHLLAEMYDRRDDGWSFRDEENDQDSDSSIKGYQAAEGLHVQEQGIETEKANEKIGVASDADRMAGRSGTSMQSQQQQQLKHQYQRKLSQSLRDWDLILQSEEHEALQGFSPHPSLGREGSGGELRIAIPDVRPQMPVGAPPPQSWSYSPGDDILSLVLTEAYHASRQSQEVDSGTHLMSPPPGTTFKPPEPESLMRGPLLPSPGKSGLLEGKLPGDKEGLRNQLFHDSPSSLEGSHAKKNVEGTAIFSGCEPPAIPGRKRSREDQARPNQVDPTLWTEVGADETCAAQDCFYRSSGKNLHHWHAKCHHVHKSGGRRGLRVHHHALDKVLTHQRVHNTGARRQRAGSVDSWNLESPSLMPALSLSEPSTSFPGDHLPSPSELRRGSLEESVESFTPSEEDWTHKEIESLKRLVLQHGEDWPAVAKTLPDKSEVQCMLKWRREFAPNEAVKGIGTWTAEEDEWLKTLVGSIGPKWADVAQQLPGRVAKQCRERYKNHLDPTLRKKEPWTEAEDATLLDLKDGPDGDFSTGWARICDHLPGRSYNDVKNRYNLIQRRRHRQGLLVRSSSKLPTTSSKGRKKRGTSRASAGRRVSGSSEDSYTYR